MLACLLHAGAWNWLPLSTVAKAVSGALISNLSSRFWYLFRSSQEKQPAAPRGGPVVSIINSLKGLSCRYPNHDGVGVLCIEARDLESLHDRNYVNDTIVDYHVKCLERSQRPDSKSSPRMLFCNCFFFKKISEGVQTTPEDKCDTVCSLMILLQLFSLSTTA
jgi:hypothetical protein